MPQRVEVRVLPFFVAVGLRPENECMDINNRPLTTELLGSKEKEEHGFSPIFDSNACVEKAVFWLCLAAAIALIPISNARDAWLETRYGQFFNDWRSVPGTITTSRGYVQKLGKNSWESRVYVEYEYRVDGRRYEGSRIRWNPIKVAGDGERADNAARILYPPAKTVTVYYASEAPQVAMLDNGKVYSGAPHQRTFLISSIPALFFLYMGVKHIWNIYLRIRARIGGQRTISKTTKARA